MTGPATGLYAWRRGSGLRPDGDEAARLLVADSWLVQDGASRGLDLHRARFTAGCAGTGEAKLSEVDSFWSAMLGLLPRRGDWFPRVELVSAADGHRLRLRVRPAPARTTEVAVWAGRGDPRAVPQRKGPDLDLLGGLRREAAEVGAGEALLTTPSGLVLESSQSGLLWWEDDTLCVPGPRLRVLPSVTVALIRRTAARQGITVAARRRRLADLAGREVWLANALHGIRPVSGWVGSTVEAGPSVRAPHWQRWWAAAAVALPRTPARPFEP
ncbi:aminotransferase class IV [Amycolatopsis taiwanensis]|uniref:Aminotransferase class IV n=1 Tax=Amycolatopsis taiwanensis TaxID=342230 RepID=A0A9W6R6Z8_9PSEU|nr:aminotransferase class IV [Amycolatopsis taiwanensis]GLY70564.1 hypothetical protein Atai01_71830 [Amycolatopsis taiwanensis]